MLFRSHEIERNEIVPSIQGKEGILDWDGFLERMDNDEKMASELLSLFMTEFPDLLKELDSVLQKKSVGEIKRIIHTIKGASSNIGAVGIAETAGEIEKSAQTKTWKYWKEKLEEKFLELKEHVGKSCQD